MAPNVGWPYFQNPKPGLLSAPHVCVPVRLRLQDGEQL